MEEGKKLTFQSFSWSTKIYDKEKIKMKKKLLVTIVAFMLSSVLQGISYPADSAKWVRVEKYWSLSNPQVDKKMNIGIKAALLEEYEKDSVVARLTMTIEWKSGDFYFERTESISIELKKSNLKIYCPFQDFVIPHTSKLEVTLQIVTIYDFAFYWWGFDINIAKGTFCILSINPQKVELYKSTPVTIEVGNSNNEPYKKEASVMLYGLKAGEWWKKKTDVSGKVEISVEPESYSFDEPDKNYLGIRIHSGDEYYNIYENEKFLMMTFPNEYISGYVTDSSNGNPIKRAKISAKNEWYGNYYYIYTNEEGYYKLYLGKAGISYKVKASAKGYLEEEKEIKVEQNQQINLDFSLKPILCISGNISDENIGPLHAGIYYLVTTNITVPSGETLTIQPGATIYFKPGCKIIANGTLEANGTPGNPIEFYLAGEEKPRMKLYHQLRLTNGGYFTPAPTS
jgi:hypothetical protein